MRTMAFAGVMVLTLTGGTLSAQQPVLIEATTVVSPHLDAPISGVSVLIEDGRIQAIEPVDELSPPPGVRRIDGRGKWVIPGIVEYHSHQTGPGPLRRALALGVTRAQTVSRPEQPNEMEARSNDPDHPSPRLHLLSGHVGSWRGPRPETPETVEEARAEILRMRAEGVKAIKIWHDDGTLWLSPDQTSDPIPRDVFVTLVRTAHEQGMEVVVHAWRLPFLRQAIDAGVDRLIHPVADSIVPDSVWQRLRGDQLAWASTMTVLLAWADIPEYARRVLSDQRLAGVLSPARRDALERARTASEFSRYAVAPRMRANRDLYMQIVQRNTLHARANGVSIVVGCDAPIGFGTHIEMELLAEIGLTPAEILSAATINGARALGADDRFGTVEVGKTADLVLLNSNPLEDIRNLRDTFLVLKGGHVFEPGELVAESNR